MRKRLLYSLGVAACAVLMAVPALAAGAAKTKAETPRHYWSPETLSGKILMVRPADHLLVVTDASGVPFDMIVTPATRIKSGDKTLTLQDLSADRTDHTSVRYTPERRGDVAQTIQLNG